MSDKTREEFEAWAVSRGYPVEISALYPDEYRLESVHEAWLGYSRAWQHQQAVIDALRAEIAQLSAHNEHLASALAKRLNELDQLRVTFHVNMMKAHPGKSHDEISAAIGEALGKPVPRDEELAQLRADLEQARKDTLATQELRNIVRADRFDRKEETGFADDTAFADWAQSRARHTLSIIDDALLAARAAGDADEGVK